MFNTIFYEPIYNALVFLVDVIPGGDIGFAIILLTIIIKFILLPLHKKAIVSQIKLKQLEPKINEIKEKYTDKQEQAAKTFELYKQEKINPLSGCLPILIQLPIIFALYRVFLNGFDFSSAENLYSFVKSPEAVNLNFLGLFDLSVKNLFLAVLAGITQFFQIDLAVKRNPAVKDDGSMGANISNMMSKQMRFIMPVFVGFISYQISGAIALYWSVNNIFTTIQEVIINKKMAKKQNVIEAEIINK
ncbi:MAG: YidC/Oxa1 family rane protein insertase [Patescibacteria group bacterium]|nr:YidC/Oxa1 family rane protein insertase [Patescibacteria group bacterium]